MPRVQAAQREVTTAPIPGVRKQTGGSAIAEGAGVEMQRAGVGETISQIGGAVAGMGMRAYADIAAQARDRADTVAVLAADRKYAEAEHRWLYEGPKAALNRQGKDALTLPEEMAAEFDKLEGEIEKELGTDRQREAFARVKNSRRIGLDLTVQRHVAGAMKKYAADELEGTLVLSQSSAGANALDPDRAELDIARGVAAIREVGPQFMSPKAVEAKVLQFTTAATTEVIDRLLINNLDREAKAYFEEAREAGQIDGKALAQIEAKVKRGTTDANGERAAAEIWEQLGPGGDADPISIDKMEDAARAKWGDDTDTLKATISALRSRAQGVQAGRREREDATNSTIWGAVVKGQSFNDVRRMPEFINAPGEVQTRVRDYYENDAARDESRAAARENRAIAAEARAERKLELEGWATYLDYKADPAKLRAMTPGEIMKRLPELGRAHVNRLLEDREKLLKDEETFRAAVIDRDLFNEVMHEAGVPGVYTSPGQRTKAQKADLGKLLSTIEEAIARKQVAQGRRLSREETEAIARQTVDAKVLVKDGWFSNDERFPALIRIDDVPADAQKQIRQALAARGLTDPSEQDIIDTFAMTLPKVKR